MSKPLATTIVVHPDLQGVRGFNLATDESLLAFSRVESQKRCHGEAPEGLRLLGGIVHLNNDGEGGRNARPLLEQALLDGD
jgi:hypothetical protein